jgi:protein FAM50
VTKATPKATEAEAEGPTTYDPLQRYDMKDRKITIPDRELEGFDDDPTTTKVVDRRWYEQNKHIYPASVWEEYKPDKNFSKNQRKDVGGNAFFFS